MDLILIRLYRYLHSTLTYDRQFLPGFAAKCNA